jgi:hypothetical protein
MRTNDHYAAAQAALDAARALPGEPTRTELLLEALTYALLAANSPGSPATPPSPREQLLAIIRREGGQWDAQRAMAACQVAGVVGRMDLSRARGDLKTLADAGLLVRVSQDRMKPVYELPRTGGSN